MGSTVEIVEAYIPDKDAFNPTHDVYYSSADEGIGIICTDHRGDGSDAQHALNILVDRLREIPRSYTIMSDEDRPVEDHPSSGLMRAAFVKADTAVQKGGLVSAVAVRMVERSVKDARRGNRSRIEAFIAARGTNNAFINDGEDITFDAIGEVSDPVYAELREVDTSSHVSLSDEGRIKKFSNRNVPGIALGSNQTNGRTSHTLLWSGDSLFLTSGTVYANLTNSEVLRTLSLGDPEIEPGIELANRARARSLDVGHVRAMRGDITVINFKVIAQPMV